MGDHLIMIVNYRARGRGRGGDGTPPAPGILREAEGTPSVHGHEHSEHARREGERERR
jgi:hypothetical protein